MVGNHQHVMHKASRWHWLTRLILTEHVSLRCKTQNVNKLKEALALRIARYAFTVCHMWLLNCLSTLNRESKKIFDLFLES